jgi:Ca-activated chloride channel family protein
MKYSLIILMYIPLQGFSQDADTYISNGNEFYKQQKFEQAVAEYVKALQLEPDNQVARFNHANALYKAGLQVEASQKFTEMAAATADKGMKAKAYYNKGVILSAQKNLEESIEAYKNALRQDPDDQQARENLQKALLELKKKNPPQPNQDQQKQNKDQQQKQNQSKLNQREADQRLRLLSQKEREVQERLQKEKARAGGGGSGKDW